MYASHHMTKTSVPLWGAHMLNLGAFKMGFSGGAAVKKKKKKPPANAGDAGLIRGSGRSPGGGHGNPLQCSCLENPMDRGAWWAMVHRVTGSWT